jgi:hypothetical protein
MRLDDVYPWYAKAPQTLGPHPHVYITPDLVQTWSFSNCAVCLTNRTSWHHISYGTHVAVCSQECLDKFRADTEETKDKVFAEANDIIKANDEWSIV